MPGGSVPARHHGRPAASHVWLTPRFVLEALGPFDLDPCAAPPEAGWPTAGVHYAAPLDDGLALPWMLTADAVRDRDRDRDRGGPGRPDPTAVEVFDPSTRTTRIAAGGEAARARVWLNPPYGRHAATWLARLANHGRGTALVFARTDTESFFRSVWERADALLFLEGRLHFHRPDGTRAAENAGAPSVLAAYGRGDAERLLDSGLRGQVVGLRRPVLVALCLRGADAAETQTWREIVADALAGLGGSARLPDIYRAIESHPRVASSGCWREKVRQTVGRMGLERRARGVYAAAA